MSLFDQTNSVDQADQRSQFLGSLLQISTYLVSVLNPEELRANLVQRVVDALPTVQAGILWLREKRVEKIYVASTYQLPLDAPAMELLVGCQLRLGEGAAGLAWQRGEPVILDETSSMREMGFRTNPRVHDLHLRFKEQLPHSSVIVYLPLRVGSETNGVLALMNLNVEPQLRQEDVPMLQTFGNLAAAAIKNAQLYGETQENRRRLQAFDAVGTAISTATDLGDLVRSVLDVVLGLNPGLVGTLLLLDPAQSRLTLGAHQGLPPAVMESQRSIPTLGAACEEVVRYGQPVLRPLMEERGELPMLDAGLTNCAYLPLLAGGTVVGVLALYGDARLHEQVDTTTLMPLGTQAGFAIANIQLYEDSRIERNKLLTVINSIAEGVVLCDTNGLLSLANEAAMSLLSLESIPYQQPLSEMPDFYGIRDLDGQPLPVERAPLARALSGEVFHDYRVLLQGASGRDSVMSFSGAPASSAQGDIEGAVVVFRDITVSQKLERAKDEFLAVAAHELRSPLAAVRGYADLLLRREQQRGEEESRDLRGLTILSQQVTHMLRMVDNLLDVSRLDAGQLDLQLQPVNLVELATEVLDQQRPSANTYDLVLSPGPAELWVRCDSLRIRQVMTNLVGNAIRYSPPHSKVLVQVTSTCPLLPSHEPEPQAGAAQAEHSHEALVTVTDEGNGIPEDQQARLFQRYYRGKSRRAEGLGLGLYLSREFVQRHNGRIWVESEEGQGSIFGFTLPMSEE